MSRVSVSKTVALLRFVTEASKITSSIKICPALGHSWCANDIIVAINAMFTQQELKGKLFQALMVSQNI